MLWWEIESPEQSGEPLMNVGHDDSRGGAREEGDEQAHRRYLCLDPLGPMFAEFGAPHQGVLLFH